MSRSAQKSCLPTPTPHGVQKGFNLQNKNVFFFEKLYKMSRSGKECLPAPPMGEGRQKHFYVDLDISIGSKYLNWSHSQPQPYGG